MLRTAERCARRLAARWAERRGRGHGDLVPAVVPGPTRCLLVPPRSGSRHWDTIRRGERRQRRSRGGALRVGEPRPATALRRHPPHQPVGGRPLGRLLREADRSRRRAARLRGNRARARLRLGVLLRRGGGADRRGVRRRARCLAPRPDPRHPLGERRRRPRLALGGDLRRRGGRVGHPLPLPNRPSGADPATAARLIDHVNDDTVRMLAGPIGGALLVALGSMLLAVALWRARTVPRWVPVSPPSAV
jgi:hypothetical protein